MSKISKALKKARQERGEEASAFKDAQERTEAPEVSAKPSYSATKVVPLCDVHQEQHRILTAMRDPAVMDRYDLLRTQILMRTRDKGWNTLMVTSVKAGEGKTLTAINLALSMAREARQTALLVGINLRNPQISCYLGLADQETGLSDYLMEDVPV
ncbi:MAG: exopolysaccharide biosynthesis protein, partial [Thermodesulfobacteriota bacterium]|nr:exopolysaccharide biosynthesis protein [Thermodesulfobacteriota bacterium]